MTVLAMFASKKDIKVLTINTFKPIKDYND